MTRVLSITTRHYTTLIDFGFFDVAVDNSAKLYVHKTAMETWAVSLVQHDNRRTAFEIGKAETVLQAADLANKLLKMRKRA